MTKVFRFLAICTIGVALATSSIAWAQTYTAVNSPGATLTELIGGPNPQGTSVGGYTLTAGGVLHGFTLRNGVFTALTLRVPRLRLLTLSIRGEILWVPTSTQVALATVSF